MKILQSGYRKGIHRKDKQVICRVSSEEFEAVKQLAEKYSNGNMSDFIRYLILTFEQSNQDEN